MGKVIVVVCLVVCLLYCNSSTAAVPQVDAAWAYYYAGDYANAIAKFTEALVSKKVPEKEVCAVHSGLAWSFYWKGDVKKAEEEFNVVLKDVPADADALKGLGFCKFIQKDYSSAIEHLKKSLAKNPYDFYAQANLALSFYYKKDFDNAKKEFGKVIELSASYAESLEFKKILDERKDFSVLYTQAGWIYYLWKDNDSAFRVFNTCVTKNKEDWEALMGLGYTYSKYGLNDKAIENLEGCLKINPKSKVIKETVYTPGTYGEFLIESDAKSTLAWCYYNNGNYDKAISLFKETLKDYPIWIDAHDGLAWSYYKKNDLKSAGSEFNKALKINKNYGSSVQGLNTVKSGKYGQYNLALSYYYTGYYDLAITGLTKIAEGKVAEYPKDEYWKASNIIGWSYYWKGMLAEAIKSFRSSLKLKDNEDTNMGLGFAYYYSGDYKNASMHLAKGVDKKIEKDTGWTILSDCLSALGWSYYLAADYDNAINAFKSLIKFHTGNDIYADPHNGLAWAYLKKGKTIEAKEEFEKTLYLVPGYVSSLEGLAEVKKTKK